MAEPANIPERLRVPFDWSVFELLPRNPVLLSWSQQVVESLRGGWLRVMTGIDDREIKRVAVNLAVSGRVAGEFALRFAHAPKMLRAAVACANVRKRALERNMHESHCEWVYKMFLGLHRK